jgi:hypothetical protein
MRMRFQPVKNAEDLVTRVSELGFLPFTHCGIPGLSVEELTPPQFWFQKDVEGPWEWRQQVIDRFAYGKLLNRNAGFVSFEWFPALCNFRRGGLDFDARYEDGRVPQLSKRLYELILQRPRSTLELKSLVPGAESGFVRAITSLMMSTDIIIVGFDAKIDSHGRPYGWGISRYEAADQAFGAMTRAAFDEEPEDSLGRMRAHILSICPDADPKAVERLLRA